MLNPRQKRIAFIGDVHGTLLELNELIDKVKSDGDTFFVLLGDLVDRGPDSEGVIRRVIELTNSGEGISIAGNHDWKAWKKGFYQTSDGRKNELPSDLKDFLGTLQPYLRVRNMLAVHGGIYPALFYNSYSSLPEPLVSWMYSNSKSQERLRRLMFVRRIDERGHKTCSIEAPGIQWAELYDGREGFAFYGHEPHLQPKVNEHAIGLDTGAVYGLNLTAYVVEDDPRNGTFYSVKAKEQYYVNAFDIK